MVSTLPTQTIILPDLPALWRFSPRANPLATPELIASCNDWVSSHSPFAENVQRKFFQCKFAEFGALVYPSFKTVAQTRTSIEQMYMYYVIDFLTDDEDPATVRKRCDEVVEALRSPNQPRADDTVLEKMTREYWSKANCSPSTSKRYIQHFVEYLDSTYEQAVGRDSQQVLPLSEYLSVRRAGSGVHPSLDLLLVSHDLPDEIYEHPVISDILECTIDLMLIVNDVYSFPMEYRSDDPYHNLVVVVMKEKHMDVQEALDFIGEWFKDLVKDFTRLNAQIPEIPGEAGQSLDYFLTAIASAVAGQIEWTFVTERYFGKDARNVKTHRTVEL